MKKIFLIFITTFFANIMSGQGAYFYADDLEYAISVTFPEDLQSAVANEYAAQMNPTTGEIDENGIYNVCYAGGFDVSTESGAESCNNFVDKIQRKYTAPYNGPYNCKTYSYQSASKNCKYVTYGGLGFYTNPKTDKEKLQKCIFDKTIDWAIKEWEGGFQQAEGDTGNRICKDGKPLYADGSLVDRKNTDPDKEIMLGATKFGITTCSSNLSVECICLMSKDQAKHYYWSQFFRQYWYYKLPEEYMAAVIQLSISGVGLVAADLRTALKAQNCTNTKIDDCYLNALNTYIQQHGDTAVSDFYEDICNARANRGKPNSKRYRRAMATKGLIRLYDECLAELGIQK